MNSYKDDPNAKKRIPKSLIFVGLVAAAVLFLNVRYGYPDRPDAAQLSAGSQVYELNLTPL